MYDNTAIVADFGDPHKNFLDQINFRISPNYDAVCEKYQRRIERFYQSIEQAKYIYFFRTHLKKHEAAELYTLLRTLYPTKQFSLIAPTDPQHMKKPWNVPGVQEFLMYPANDTTHKVHGDSAYWDNILKKLHLI